MKILISVCPNFQLVRSILSFRFSLFGKRLKISFAIKSESKAYWAIKRWIRLKLEAALAPLSNALDSFSKPTVWTLHKAITNMDSNFNRDKLTFPLKWVFNIDMNSLFLLSTLIFSIRKMSGIILLIYTHLRA